MPIVKTSAKGQVVIPSEIRKRIGLKPGQKVLVSRAGGHKVILEPVPDDPIEAACGIFQSDDSLVETLLKERREDNTREEKKFARFLRPPRLSEQRARVRKG